MDGRFTGWTRPHGGVRGPDAPSGQMVKSHQTLAMALGPWGHGYNAEQASVAIMHGSCMLSAFCMRSARVPRCRARGTHLLERLKWPGQRPRSGSVFCVVCFRLKIVLFSAPSEHPFMHALCVPFRLSRLTLSFDVLHRTIHAVWPCESVFVLCVPCALLDASVCAVPMNAFCCLARGNDGIPDPVTHALCVPFDVPHDPRSACAVGCESVFVPCVPCAPLHASVCSVPLNTTCCLARGNEGIPDPVMSSLRAVR